MDDWVAGRVTFRIGGQPVDVEFTLPGWPVPAHHMLPLFQQVTDLFVEATTQSAAAEGQPVSCRRGCAACCRQAVPVSEAEVHQIAELVAALPEPRRSAMRARFAAAVAQLRAAGWFDALDAWNDSGDTQASLAQIVLQYFRQHVDCPFLENETCSIHGMRPLACREYLVSSPPENCSTPSERNVHKVRMALRPSRPVRNLSATGSLGNRRFLPLVLALELAQRHPQAPAEKTGPEWMKAFLGELAGPAGSEP